ncbi:MAG TPA: chorismate mutase [Atribacteraceae bacterium]|nr:chorismate mutase [Atribacteraceae bacterium]
MMRGIRGAICIDEDTHEQVLKAALDLFEKILEQNQLIPEAVGAVFITVTPDIRSAFPAEGIRRQDDFRLVPTMCAQEIPVSGALEKCLRMLVLADQPGKGQDDVHHIYLGQALALRRDLETMS